MNTATTQTSSNNRPAFEIFYVEERKAGVAFLNQDESFSLILGDRGDPEQLRYQLRGTPSRRYPARPRNEAPSKAPAEPAHAGEATQAHEATPSARTMVRRRKQSEEAASAAA